MSSSIVISPSSSGVGSTGFAASVSLSVSVSAYARAELTATSSSAATWARPESPMVTGSRHRSGSVNGPSICERDPAEDPQRILRGGGEGLGPLGDAERAAVEEVLDREERRQRDAF